MVDIAQIDLVAAVTLKEDRVLGQSVLDAAERLERLDIAPIAQVENHVLVAGLGIFDIGQAQGVVAKGCLDDELVGRRRTQARKFVEQLRHALVGHGLEQVVEGADFVRLQCELGRRGQEHQANGGIGLAQLAGGVHAVDEWHDHVEHDDIGARGGMARQQVFAARDERNVDRRTRLGRPAVDHAMQVI